MFGRRDKSDVRPIPIPLGQRWRSSRYRLLPVAIFGVAVVLAFRMLGNHSSQAGAVMGIARGRVFQVSAAYMGRIRNIPVRLFDRVSRDQVVAVVGDDLLAAQIATVSGEISRLRAEYERERGVLIADVANRRSEWVAESRAFLGDVVQLKVKMLDLITAIDEDRALLKGLTLEMGNAARLVREKALAAIELERTKAAHDALVAKIRRNEQAFEDLEAERKAAEARTRDYRNHTPVLPSEKLDLEHLRKAIEVQEGLIRELETQRSEMVLRAPFDGIVIEVQPRAGDAVMRRPGEGILRREGEVVASGEPILAIAETSPSEVIAYAGEHQMQDLTVGTVVQIRTRTRPAHTGSSRAVAVAPTVERLPERLWANPQVPAWGRPFLVSIPPGMELSPGELVLVRWR